ncbi:glycerol-3-phosphate dehydrogenase [NAD(P)+] [Leuconostoc litchii]|uniref:Glycerol-3-phosphate dehydrogenase [NAD(P)+] n=1 Tax=Leuconostoc litchii TaxID=1981069 RepID=A0A6P2CQE1_9LACO|nr:NAD(P)H-dependent glycerol-3-phosphate dehydrogenase [Leuconostoc litchii]TYC47332.1 NAD(P)H-dependent glycerol-3-phosphate dehydrogenase [Leuconostoc litchii]GMA69332.1 glycerol-3-phosphate dehydrogenase [NAD(P)+] [Leuconostoc litchii]
MTKIAVLGGGSWGSALANVAAENDNDVRLWTRTATQADEINGQHTNQKYLPNAKLSDGLMATSNLALAVMDAEVVLIVVPTKVVREVASQLADVLNKQNHRVILAHATKGLEQETYKRISEMLFEEVPEKYRSSLAMVSGPSHAEDVIKHDLTAVSIASDDKAAAQKLQKIFANASFRPYTNNDLLGSELAAALKNIIAIGSGALVGLGYGANAQAALLTRGLSEMRALGLAMGAQPETFLGLAGIGDLIVTGMSPNSRNYRAGQQLGEGKNLQEIQDQMGMVIEGVSTTKAVYEFAKQNHVEMPITEGIYRILYQNEPLREVIQDLMSRPLRSEN